MKWTHKQLKSNKLPEKQDKTKRNPTYESLNAIMEWKFKCYNGYETNFEKKKKVLFRFQAIDKNWQNAGPNKIIYRWIAIGR